MSSFVEAVASVIAVIGSLLGVIAAIEALTAGARLRRRAELLRAEIAAADRERDKAVLQSLHRETVAQLVAMQGVPTLSFLIGGGFLYGGLTFAYYVGSLLIVEMKVRQAALLQPWTGYPLALVGLIVGAGVILSLDVSNMVVRAIERRRTVLQYLNGQDLDRWVRRHKHRIFSPEDAAFFTPEKKSAHQMTYSVYMLVIGLSTGLTCLAALLGTISADGALELYKSMTFSPFGILISLIALSLCFGVPSAIEIHRQTRPEWVHPRPPHLQLPRLFVPPPMRHRARRDKP